VLIKRKALGVTIIVWFVASTLIATDFTNLTKADPYIPPEEVPSGYRIYGNGTCTAENIRREGEVYTLTGDIEGTIVIERNGIVLDGTGHTLQGNGSSYGVWLQDKMDVTIKNLSIRNFGHGIRFSHYAPDWHTGQKNPHYTTNCTIQACNITNSGYGITFYSCLNCSVLGNYVANNTYGIKFYGSGNTFRNNSIEENQYNFWESYEGESDVDTSNTVDGKPIYYWVNQHNMTVPDDAGIVILKHCSGIRVQNLNLTGNALGVSLYYTSNSEIFGNNITDNYWRGIAVWWSCNNSIIGNQITNSEYYGIEVYDSHNNTISHNLIRNNNFDGIYHRTAPTNEVISSNQIVANRGFGIFGGSYNCIIADNFIYGNSGTGLTSGDNSIVTGNNITQNGGAGVDLGGNVKFEGNYISKNDIGVNLFGEYAEIISNAFVDNSQWAIKCGPAANNTIFNNNFIGNNHNKDQIFFYKNPYWLFANSWDNGTVGNYWSDFNPESQSSGNKSVYFINYLNQDNHPLLAPLEFAALELPSIQPPQEPSPTPPPAYQTETITLVIACLASVVIVSIGLLVYFFKKHKH
jgi:parallel beta-helix repeat protein